MSNFNLNELKIRPLVDKDWELIIPWRQQSGMSNLNEAILNLSSKLKHCQRTVIVDEIDTPLCYISAAFYSKFVYIGAYITDPNHRGKGIGSTLWKSVMDKIGDKNIYLKSMPPMTEKYSRVSNFIHKSTVTYLRYEGRMDFNVLDTIIGEYGNDKCCTLSSTLNESMVEKICQYDSRVRNEDTTSFFTLWLHLCMVTSSNSKPIIFTSFALNDRNELVGYGSIVLYQNGRRIGPLIADNDHIFLLLFRELINHKFEDSTNENEEITMSIASVNKKANDVVVKANFKLTLTMERIFTKTVENFRHDKIYCLIMNLGVPE